MTLLQRLATSMHPLAVQQKWFAVKAYFDESGDETNLQCDVMAFAGLVAPSNSWDSFEPKWKARLRKAKLDPATQCFHAADFHGGYKPFSTYQWEDNSYKTHFLSDLSSILTKTVSYIAIHAVVVRDWRAIIGPNLTKTEASKARACYQFLMMMCMDSIVGWKKRNGIEEKIVCILDRKKDVEAYARSYFYQQLEESKVFAGTFESADWKNKQDFIPLQAADLVAYEGYQTALNVELRKKIKLRPEFDRIFTVLEKKGRIDIHWYTEHELRAWVRNAEITLGVSPRKGHS